MLYTRNSLQGILKPWLRGLTAEFMIQEVWGGAHECAFPTFSQGRLMLLVRDPHFGKHSPQLASSAWDASTLELEGIPRRQSTRVSALDT